MHDNDKLSGQIASYQSSWIGPALSSLKLCLQMRRGMEVTALFTGTTAFYVIHTDRDNTIRWINLDMFWGVCKPTIWFCSFTISSLIFTTHLINKNSHIKFISNQFNLYYLKPICSRCFLRSNQCRWRRNNTIICG